MRKISCVIIDDEPEHVEALKDLIEKHAPFLKIVGTAHSISTGYACLKDTQPELVFLDIILGSGTSFDLLEQLEEYSFNIIFSTSHEAFALRAYDYPSLYYLVKPVNEKTFNKAMAKIQANPDLYLAKEQVREAKQVNSWVVAKLAIPDRKGITYIEQKDINYLKSAGSYTEIYLKNGAKNVISQRLGLVMEKLIPEYFIRVHKKYVINLTEVAYYENGKPGSVYLKNGEYVNISSSHKEELLKRLGEH